MPVPVKERYFEDYLTGEVIEFGNHLITEEEIIEFASRYDPQPFHIDRDAAAKSHFGGLVASGWMTGAVMMRMMVDGFISRNASMGSPGMTDLRWLVPVRPGDRLRCRATVGETRRSQSKPDRGMVNVRWETLNQDDVVVMVADGVGMYKTRAAT